MLAIEKARKRFASGDDVVVTALDDVSLALEPGSGKDISFCAAGSSSTVVKATPTNTLA